MRPETRPRLRSRRFIFARSTWLDSRTLDFLKDESIDDFAAAIALPRLLQELFGQVGRVLNAGINYGPNGKSKGTAEVTLATLESALKAVKTYNGVKLDGRPLNIVIVDAPQQPKQKPITQRLSGLKQQPKNKNGKQQQKKAPVPAPKRGKATQKVVASAKKAAPKKKKPARKPKEKKAAPTAADLDASLDAYNASADVQMAA